MESYAWYILDECSSLKRGYHLAITQWKNERIIRDITIEKWKNKISSE